MSKAVRGTETQNNSGIKIKIPDIDALTSFIINATKIAGDMTRDDLEIALIATLLQDTSPKSKHWGYNLENSLLCKIKIDATGHYDVEKGAKAEIDCSLYFANSIDSYRIVKKLKAVKRELDTFKISTTKKPDKFRTLWISDGIDPDTIVEVEMGHKSAKEAKGSIDFNETQGNNPIYISLVSPSLDKQHLAAQLRTFTKVSSAIINSFYEVLNKQSPDMTINLDV